MDLLACLRCDGRFYLPGMGAPESRRCPQCGGDLLVSMHGISSIPLDARSLDARAPTGAPRLWA
jgi:PHP family Zn ribbon phosphoesterase